MRKHLYFHSSNLDYIKDLKDDDLFEPACSYSYKEIEEIKNVYEYGRIKTDKNYYHLILGCLSYEKKKKGCPWCHGEGELIKILPTEKSFLTIQKCFIQCKNCKAQGPIRLINISVESDMQNSYIKEMMLQEFTDTKNWDQ